MVIMGWSWDLSQSWNWTWSLGYVVVLSWVGLSMGFRLQVYLPLSFLICLCQSIPIIYTHPPYPGSHTCHIFLSCRFLFTGRAMNMKLGVLVLWVLHLDWRWRRGAGGRLADRKVGHWGYYIKCVHRYIIWHALLMNCGVIE
jgi:hypothetical protein